MQTQQLTGLAWRLFQVQCEEENLRARLDELKLQEAALQDGIFFLHPLYEDQVIHLEDLVLVISPRQVEAMTPDQYEKSGTKDI